MQAIEVIGTRVAPVVRATTGAPEAAAELA
jgi:hypothetical protein